MSPFRASPPDSASTFEQSEESQADLQPNQPQSRRSSRRLYQFWEALVSVELSASAATLKNIVCQRSLGLASRFWDAPYREKATV